MKIRIEKHFVHHGCGFPVVLEEVEIGEMGPDEIILVNSNELSRKALVSVAHKPTRLTGSEVHFVRVHFELTLAQFGELFDVTHPAVKKWEEKRDETASMSWGNELLLRLFVLDKLKLSAGAFRNAYKSLINPRPEGEYLHRITVDRVTQSPRASAGG